MIYTLLTIYLLLLSQQPAQLASSIDHQPVIILKLDDLWYEDGLVHPGWIQVMDFLQEEEVVGTVGVVCNSLEAASHDYYQWIKDREAEGHEIWHHGYCHCKPVIDGQEFREFRGTGYDYQYDHLSKVQQLAREKLGIVFKTFGAPYNSTDDNTAKALDHLSDIKVWLYKETDSPTNKFVLDRIAAVNIEHPVHIPDYDKFLEGFVAHKDKAVLVIQGHPRSWVEETGRFEAFKEIIHYLKKKGTRFTTPYRYYQLQADLQSSK